MALRTEVKRLSIALNSGTPKLFMYIRWSMQAGLTKLKITLLQRKVLTPNDFESLEELENRILSFQTEYEKVSRLFEWKFTREDMKK